MTAGDYAFNALCVVVNLAVLVLNIKLYTEGMKDRNMSGRKP